MDFIPPAGEEASFPLISADDHDSGSFPTIISATLSNTMMVRHGSSLSLMSQVCQFLASADHDDSFNHVDPTKDHHKWGRKGMSLYYAAVVDMADKNKILCALRAATDGMADNNASDSDGKKRKLDSAPATTASTTAAGGNSNQTTKRFLIDYVYTAPEARGRGIAGLLVQQILDMVSQNNPQNSKYKNFVNCYVLSIEDSCVYWMEKHGFYLCQSPHLNKLLNLFPDTHLLKLKSNKHTVDGDDTDNKENDSDEEDAKLRLQQSGSSSSSSSSGSSESSSSSHSATAEAFGQALAKLLELQQCNSTTKEDLKLCLTTLAVLIRNATQATLSDSDDDDQAKEMKKKKRKIRINNPHVHRRVFRVGGDAAMQLLQACNFDLEVDNEGDAILHYHSTSSSGDGNWLSATISQLEHEASQL